MKTKNTNKKEIVKLSNAKMQTIIGGANARVLEFNK